MVCPRCNLSYPETVSRCGCGYDFKLRRVAHPGSREVDLPGSDESSRKESRPVPITLWIFSAGGSALLAAAWGLLEFPSESNQLGPLIAVFFAPVGAILGLLAWGVSRIFRIPASAQWWTLPATCAAVSLWALYSVMPPPVARGYAIDAEVQSCEPAEQAADAAIHAWEERMARSNWHGMDRVPVRVFRPASWS